jgi:hypothetical protein
MERFVNAVFPGTVKTAKGQDQSLRRGPHKYSRIWQARSLMVELFPGLEVGGESSVMKGGTFVGGREKTLVPDRHLNKPR